MKYLIQEHYRGNIKIFKKLTDLAEYQAELIYKEIPYNVNYIRDFDTIDTKQEKTVSRSKIYRL